MTGLRVVCEDLGKIYVWIPKQTDAEASAEMRK
jgi:hypothetical protein